MLFIEDRADGSEHDSVVWVSMMSRSTPATSPENPPCDGRRGSASTAFRDSAGRISFRFAPSHVQPDDSQLGGDSWLSFRR